MEFSVIKLNLVKDKDFPYQSASGALLDSGQYSKLINKKFFEVIIFTLSPFLKIDCNSLLFPLISHPIAVLLLLLVTTLIELIKS